MNYVKITTGYVRQTFNDIGECISQEFIASDDVKLETTEGYPLTPDEVSLKGRECFPFTMYQPSVRYNPQ